MGIERKSRCMWCMCATPSPTPTPTLGVVVHVRDLRWGVRVRVRFRGMCATYVFGRLPLEFEERMAIDDGYVPRVAATAAAPLCPGFTGHRHSTAVRLQPADDEGED